MTLGLRGGAGGEGAVVVQHVAPSSEAERAGVAVGDVLVRVAGTAVTSPESARALLDGPLHSDVVLEIERNGQRLSLSVQRENVRR
jgi:C-terminal processing protease CtpA/Prc